MIIKDFNIARSADDNKPYMTENNMDGVVKSLKAILTKFKWFSDNLMKSNMTSVIYWLAQLSQKIT